jgi:serine/threonine protein kinase
LLQQLLQGLAALQAQGISHRDVKPENLLVRELANSSSSSSGSSGSSSSSRGGSGRGSSSSNKDGGGCKLHPLPADLHLRLIDFGSAVDAHSIASGLFGPLGQPQHHSSSSNSSSSSRSGGPSVDELTMEYAAPEVLFASR